MTRILKLFVLMLIILPSALQAFTATFEQTISHNDQTIANFNIIIEDNSLRAESTIGDVNTVMIRNDSGSYSYFPDQNVAYKVPDTSSPNISDDLPDYMGFLKKQNAKKVGSEKLGQYDCDIYEFMDSASSQPSKAWVWKEKAFPIKIEVETPEGIVRVKFNDIQIGIEVDSKSFEFSSETKLLTMPEVA